ncbi:hypothetical protein K7432_015329 [Basidiobolus ranarum]|uniref:Arrestin-like N-terminal domain-containing protein n=1 Tax=Basidiobolus ranarum TaxID=34480 RepID=A0ABR2WGB5_9FUNG
MFDRSGDSDKNISIHVESRNQHGPLGLPVIYSTPEVPAVIRGYVELNSTKEFKGKDISLQFLAKARSHWTQQYGQTTVTYSGKHILMEKEFDMKLDHIRPGVIGPGQTRCNFEVTLLPSMPSSVKGRHGRMSYCFTATLERSFPHRDMIVEADVWLYSSSLPIPSPLNPTTVKDYRGLWNDCLPYTCTLKSDTLYQGQTVPITIQFAPFIANCRLYGQEVVVVSATVKLKQYQQLYSTRGSDKSKKELLTVHVNTGWPSTVKGWERTLMVIMPEAPILSATIHTNVVIKTHILKVIMMLRTNTQTDRQAKEFRVESKYDMD